ncbi:2-oxoacid:ferredoxin oxidoreductase subunit beta [bacterium]|jgi:2-oxoglutarate ferredoxin oxidoreductase subunit beta|nr:2-oxoacid:ferredoxin oxidoreductase subunit beta [bacterium]NBW56438.1 2-oxoacid:ferredoxin oxidoreductase subunit beta [bacterium]NBX71447.1 2-oxoacid:ferredoxin oxidoreductase subunit beta [bacterium]
MSAQAFANEQTVRWCPGCGDYAILKYLQATLERMHLSPSEVVVISGIGCASRLPYYLSCYGFHTIHGRAPCIATGVAIAKPDLPVIIITGDGDGLSIGLHHLLHMLRRNVNVTVLLMNNRVYGLTKGQASPTSQHGQMTKTSQLGHHEDPLDPLSVALAAGASMIGRCFDVHGLVMQRLIQASLEHQGTSLIEIYQNCPIFNDGAFGQVGKADSTNPHVCTVWPQEPIIFAQNNTLVQDVNGWHVAQDQEPSYYEASKLNAQMLLQLQSPIVTGLIYQEKRPIYQVQRSQKPIIGSFARACEHLLTWSISD